MNYFKNTELAKLYNVSEKTVRNWIQSASEGKLDLQLYEHNTKLHIANTAHNTYFINQLTEKGQKFKNTRGKKSVTPTKEFYESYTTGEIYDIISNLEVHHEIPHKYVYYSSGAQDWDAYTRKLAAQSFPNSLNNTMELLRLSEAYLGILVQGYTHVNIVDLGVGNAYPVRELLQHFLDKGTLHRYIAIDASQDMIAIAEQNITQWFGDKVSFEEHLMDINYDKFNNFLVNDLLTKKDESIVNIVLFLGGTIVNLRDMDLSLRMIYNSIGKDDLFILSRKLDTPSARRFFDLNVIDNAPKLVNKERMIVDMLGIDESFYDVEQIFDSEERQRSIKIRLRVDLAITFHLDSKSRTVLLSKGEGVLVWRAHHQTFLETAHQLDQNGFDVLSSTKSRLPEQQYGQFITRIKDRSNQDS